MQALFERGSSYNSDDQKYHSHYIIRCSKCKETDEVRFNRRTHSLPPEVIQQKFTQRGWVIGKTRQNDICPQCLARVVTDRAARQNIAKAEAKRAAADLVITEAKAPYPASTITNVELSRQQLMLLDRTAEIYRVSSYLSAQLDGLIDRLADLEAEREAVVRRITSMTGEPVATEEVPPVPFERLQSHANIGIKIGYYPAARQTVITLNPEIIEQAGITGYVTLSIGDGADAGVVRIEPAPLTSANTRGVHKVSTEPSGTRRISISAFRPADRIPKTEVRYKIQPDGIYIRLPPSFTSPPVEDRHHQHHEEHSTNGILSSRTQ